MIARNAELCAAEAPRPVSYGDVTALYLALGALAAIIADQADRLAAVERRVFGKHGAKPK
jgi:hypothetical protein